MDLSYLVTYKGIVLDGQILIPADEASCSSWIFEKGLAMLMWRADSYFELAGSSNAFLLSE